MNEEVELLIRNATITYAMGNITRALMLFTEALQYDPENIYVLYNCGCLWGELGSDLRAYSFYEVARKLLPDPSSEVSEQWRFLYASIMFNRGNALGKARMLTEALESFKAAWRWSPHMDIQQAIRDVYADTGKFVELYAFNYANEYVN